MPMVAPGTNIPKLTFPGLTFAALTFPAGRTVGYTLCLRRAPAVESPRDGNITQSEDRRGKQCCIDGSRLADGKGRDRDPRRHLDDRQQAVDAFQGSALDRH